MAWQNLAKTAKDNFLLFIVLPCIYCAGRRRPALGTSLVKPTLPKKTKNNKKKKRFHLGQLIVVLLLLDGSSRHCLVDKVIPNRYSSCHKLDHVQEKLRFFFYSRGKLLFGRATVMGELNILLIMVDYSLMNPNVS